MLLYARSRDLLSCRHQKPGGGWRAAGGRRQEAGGGRQEAGGGRREAGGGRREAGGGRQEAGGGGRNHDLGRYHSLNVIFSEATVTRSHDASWLWC